MTTADDAEYPTFSEQEFFPHRRWRSQRLGSVRRAVDSLLSVNTLYIGENLDILGRYVKDETIDLVYLDPPFKSNRDYNMFPNREGGARAEAQERAFLDTWRWGPAANHAWQTLREEQGPVGDAIRGSTGCWGRSN